MNEKLSPLRENTPIVASDPDELKWDDEADLVVVGFGAAGACAALAAREAGLDVLVVDRFDGGGSTAVSGGVYYAGATRFQKEAGFDDTNQNMFNYLQHEVGDVVSPETLRRFCEESTENLEWMIRHGAKFSGQMRSMNAEYMEVGYSLYFSGNERSKKMSEAAKPAPRGHIYQGEGTGSMGRYLFAALREAVVGIGARFATHSPATRLIVDNKGAVIGVETNQLARGTPSRRRHERYIRWFAKGQGVLYGPMARWLSQKMNDAEESGARRLIRARHGVVLATGGFIHNRKLVAEYLPQHLNGITMGMAGDTGAGIFLGTSVGGSADYLHHVFTSRALQFKPYMKGLLVDGEGKRFINEDAYGATIGRQVADRGGRAWLILDRELYFGIWKLIMPWRPMIMRYRMRAFLSVALGARHARTIDALASKCELSADNLKAAMAEYADIAQGQTEDPYGKLDMHLHVLRGGPYYAIDCSTASKGWPPLTFTLGGLRVDEETGHVLRQDGERISNLYAAGRTAIGVSSNNYISGLSIADVVFSGRRAGKSVAAAAKGELGQAEKSRT